jgi:hypothetical protein
MSHCHTHTPLGVAVPVQCNTKPNLPELLLSHSIGSPSVAPQAPVAAFDRLSHCIDTQHPRITLHLQLKNA